jgi:GNAT superfamily N-acetyltransferase
VAFHQRLSPRSVYRRFFFVHPVLTAGEVERFTCVDQVDRLALVAEDGGRLVAVGRYDRNAGSQDAEVAFVVADDHQHRGIGPQLLAALARAAGARGITSFVASVLVENSEMLRVFRHSGFALGTSSEGGVVNVRLELTERHPPVDLGPSPPAGSEGEGAAEGLGPVGHVA